MMELMIVVVVVAVLAGIAITSYQGSIVKTRRSAAQTCLQQQAQFMERYYTTNMTYTGAEKTNETGTCDPSLNLDNFYRFEMTTQPMSFSLRAIPQGQQAGDRCGDLTLTNTGQRTAAGGDGCW
ncbi:MAG TPA: type IV pilin protein [Xylella sp.]